MLHVIEVRPASVTDALLKRLDAFTQGYPVAEKPFVAPPSLEGGVDEAPFVLESVLGVHWDYDKKQATQTIIYHPKPGHHLLTMLIEADGNKAAIYIYHDASLVRNKTQVYIGYNSTLGYNGFLTSSLGLTTDDWRFVKLTPNQTK